MDISNQRQGPKGIFIPLQDRVAQPIIPQSANLQNYIVMNQMVQPQIIYVDSTNFKSSPCDTVCPFCKGQIKTEINRKCNWYSCALCYCCGILPWIAFQCCRNKALNCVDAEHFCPNCGNKIVEYTSC